MFNRILLIFAIKKQEILILLLSVLQAMLVGAFIGGFDISVHAIFLKSYSYLEIPQAFVIAGILGIFLFLIYIYLSTRLSFRLFILLNYVILFISSFAVYFVSDLEYNKLFIKFGYALMFPLNIIAFLNLWRSMREIFTPSQTKRLFIFLQIAFYGGLVAASYGIILFLFQTRTVEYITLLSSLCILLVIIIQLILNPLHKFSKYFYHKPKKINPLRSRFIELFYSKYTVLLFLFVILSSVIGFLVHYNFIAATRNNYPDIVGFAKFLGLFTGSLFMILFFVDKILIRKVLYSYDSPYSLVLISSALLLFLILLMIIFFTLGNTRLIARFSFYFVVIAIIKTFYEISKYTIEVPSLRVLFYTLDIRFHSTIIPRIEGITRTIGLLITGLLLYALLKIKFINLFYLNIFTSVLVIVWIFVAVLLIKAFQNALRIYIKRIRATKRENEIELSAVDEKLQWLLNHGTDEKIISSLQISERIEPIAYENHIVNLLHYDDESVQNHVLNKISEQNILIATPTLKEITFGVQALDSFKNQIVQKFEQKISNGSTEKQIEKLANSSNTNDRVLAAELIGYLNKNEFSSILINLSRDFEPDVKQASIKALARTAFSENSHTLVGFLNSSTFYSYAFEALVRIGNDACDHLDQLFLAPDSDNKLLARIVKIYGKIGSQKTIELLLNKIENQNKFIAGQAIIALREARFQASLGNINRILNATVRNCNIMSWNYMVYASLQNNKKYQLLANAMHSEIEDNYNLLYHLLSLAYNSNSISNIRKLIDSGSDTDISYAMELLDQIVIDDVKQVLFPLLENLSAKNRIRKLQFFFLSDKIPLQDLLAEIITRDFNLISIYLKSCAIISWPLQNNNVDNILLFCLFHPHKLIRETAAYVIDKLDPEKLEDVFPRLESEYVSDIQLSLNKIKSHTDILILEKIEFLKKCYGFKNVSEDILFELASSLKFQRVFKDENLLLSKNNNQYAILFIFEGEIEIKSANDKSVVFTKENIFYTEPFLIDCQSQINIKALSDVILLSVDRDILNTLIFDYFELRKIVLELIDATI